MISSLSNDTRPVIVVYFIGGVTYTEIAALRYLAKKVMELNIIECRKDLTPI